MRSRRWFAVVLFVAASVAGVGVACSGAANDGESCSSGSDCKSKTCNAGTCGGSSCDCAQGVCTSGTSCQGGWACVREGTGAGSAFPQCRRLCPNGTGCLADEHCAPDGVCHAGITPPTLAWGHLPRSSPCAAFTDCPFAVKVTGGSGAIDHYAWAFDDSPDGSVSTNDPTITHRYSPGAHTTIVTALDKNGTNASLDTTDSICVDGDQLQCTPNVVDCCLGTCNPEGGCR